MPRAKKVPPGMPVVADAQGSERERLATWFKDQIERVQIEHEERVALLRTVGEHPSPLFSKFVRKFAGLVSKTHIAKLLDISYATLMTHYADDIELGAAQTNAMVATNMLRIATSENDPAASKVGMDWLDRRGGTDWKKSQKIEMTDDRAAPPVIDSSKLTFAERQQLRIMLERVANGGEGDPVEPDDEGILIP